MRGPENKSQFLLFVWKSTTQTMLAGRKDAAAGWVGRKMMMRERDFENNKKIFSWMPCQRETQKNKNGERRRRNSFSNISPGIKGTELVIWTGTFHNSALFLEQENLKRTGWTEQDYQTTKIRQN